MPSVHQYKTAISWVREKKLCTFISSFSLLMLGILWGGCKKMKKFLFTEHMIALYLLSSLFSWLIPAFGIVCWLPISTCDFFRGLCRSLHCRDPCWTIWNTFKKSGPSCLQFSFECSRLGTFLSYCFLFANFQATEKYLAEYLIYNYIYVCVYV